MLSCKWGIVPFTNICNASPLCWARIASGNTKFDWIPDMSVRLLWLKKPWLLCFGLMHAHLNCIRELFVPLYVLASACFAIQSFRAPFTPTHFCRVILEWLSVSGAKNSHFALLRFHLPCILEREMISNKSRCAFYLSWLGKRECGRWYLFIAYSALDLQT